MLIIPGVIASSFPRASTAFESIATATLTSAASSISISSIPSTYQHLQLRCRVQSTANTGNIREVNLTINSDTGTNYARHSLIGDGGTAFANSGATRANINHQWCPDQSLGSGFWGVACFDFHDYANTSKFKTVRLLAGGEQNNSAYGRIILGSGLWQSTSAITSISLAPDSGNFSAGTTIALYGIKGVQ